MTAYDCPECGRGLARWGGDRWSCLTCMETFDARVLRGCGYE